MDLLTAAQKAFCEDSLRNVFDTWADQILIYKQSNTTIISSNPAEFNFIYQNNQPSVTTTIQPVSGVFQGSVNWGNPDNFNQREIRPAIDGELCQVDLLADGYAFLQGYETVIVNGILVEKSAEHPNYRPHGIFTPSYFCTTFRRVN